MSYTTLRITEDGVIGYEHHLARIRPAGRLAVEAFVDFAAGARPGIFVVIGRPEGLMILPRSASLLHDGLPFERTPSPFLDAPGRFPKPGPGSAYDALRPPGRAVLLTDRAGGEILESSLSAVVGWDGDRFVLPPPDRPRVDSVAEAIVRDSGRALGAPLLVGGDLPLSLVNAVGAWRLGTERCSGGPNFVRLTRGSFPEEALALLRELLAASARRP